MTNAMKWALAIVPLWILLRTSASAQEQPPKVLVEAAHCLAVKKYIPEGSTDIENSKTAKVNLGYLVDTKSYPGEKVIYVVSYTKPDHSEGYVYILFFGQGNGKQNLNIQNNAKFARVTKGGDYDGVLFVEPPLGGEWTQKHITSAIKQIEQRPSFSLPTKEVLGPSPRTGCLSYTDKK